MSTESVGSSQGAQSSSQSGSSVPVGAGVPVGKAAGYHEVTGSSTVGSVADLKNKAPEIYQKMLEGIGMSICNKMKKHQEDLKKLRQEYERNG